MFSFWQSFAKVLRPSLKRRCKREKVCCRNLRLTFVSDISSTSLSSSAAPSFARVFDSSSEMNVLLDSKEQLAPSGVVASGKGFYTVGIIVEKSRVLESQKTGKRFIILKVSDLVKYDMAKVR